MDGQSSNFKGFGSGVQPSVSRPRSKLFRFARVVAVFLIAMLAPFALSGWGDIYQGHLERDPPIIEIKKPPVGLGLEPVSIEFTLRDKYAGLDEVTVRVEQAGKPREIFQKKYPAKIRVDDVSFPMNGKELGLREGEARLNIVAFDKSFWNNVARTSVQLRVDYTRPEVTLYPDQRNAVLGGTEMVFYRLRETVDTFSGITVGPELLPGFPAKNFDPDFENFPEIYCAFFPISRDFNAATSTMKLFARDAVGNTSTAPVNYHVQNFAVRPSVETVAPEMLAAKIEPLYEQFLDRQARLNGQDPMRPLPAQGDAERIERFKIVNEQYRALIERALKPLFSKPKATRFWKESFARFGGRERHVFGEKISYRMGEVDLGSTVENGVTFASAVDAPVRAANNGIVIFSDNLGPYGDTVIVDHGFGVTTLYGHLGSMTRLEGDRVERGDIIGKVGDTGLIFSPGLTFEVRLHGTPVRPVEWWDAGWLRDHVDQKVSNAKKTLGIRTVVPLADERLNP